MTFFVRFLERLGVQPCIDHQLLKVFMPHHIGSMIEICFGLDKLRTESPPERVAGYMTANPRRLNMSFNYPLNPADR